MGVPSPSAKGTSLEKVKGRVLSASPPRAGRWVHQLAKGRARSITTNPQQADGPSIHTLACPPSVRLHRALELSFSGVMVWICARLSWCELLPGRGDGLPVGGVMMESVGWLRGSPSLGCLPSLGQRGVWVWPCTVQRLFTVLAGITLGWLLRCLCRFFFFTLRGNVHCSDTYRT